MTRLCLVCEAGWFPGEPLALFRFGLLELDRNMLCLIWVQVARFVVTVGVEW